MKQKPRSFIALLLTAVLAAVLLCGCHAGTVKRSDDTSGTVPLPTAGSGSEKTTAPKADTASSERTDRPNDRLFCRSRKAHCCKGNNRFCPNESVCGVGEGSRKHGDRAADTDTDQRQHARLIYGLLRQHFAARYLSVLVVHTVRSHGEYAADRISARRFGKRR